MVANLLWLAVAGTAVNAAYLDKRQASSSTSGPQYFQTSPELYAGPTATGAAPFLAQTNPAPFGPSRTYVPNTPLQTAEPIQGNTKNQNIFELMGELSPYFPNPGLGVDEYPLPIGSNISQWHMLHRHGSRYPTSGSNVETFGQNVSYAKGNGTFKASGQLEFLNYWSYQLGAEILVPRGRQELFDSGVLHYYQYGRLYNTSSKIIVRSTTEDRMTKSAENWLSGFFGLDWTKNATLELLIEQDGFNNSLAGYDNCNNSNLGVSYGGDNASDIWEMSYLANATERLSKLVEGYNWTVADTYAAQNMCPYETVAYGYSTFCDLFTFEEWQGFEYSIDLAFNGNDGFASPTGRAVGVGYVEELVSRLQNQLPNTTDTQANATLDGSTSTFPLNQSLYLDFSHDTNIYSILTAFSLRQFAEDLPDSGPPASRNLTVSHLTPFAARLDVEIIKTPAPVPANRTSDYIQGPPTTYVHFILNQRTIPLHFSLPECESRVDGWCTLTDFLDAQSRAKELANYDYACNGDYPSSPYGTIKDGAPLQS
ncbi:MAG: hypothetical protein M4579_003437 [Chaenotheca gracillima]|nr:MAG: hypothetical protein M4579_003437 [Chaenotheca gracillima]